MATWLPWLSLFAFIIIIWLQRCQSELCHVQPECSCTRNTGSYIYCNTVYGPYVPRFAKSTVNFGGLVIRGNSGITRIREDTFEELKLTRLTIQNTKISYLGCNALDGIDRPLQRVYLTNNLLTHVPNCALSKFTSLRHLYLSTNRITQLLRGTFSNFSVLDTLDLNSNQIRTIKAGAFDGLSKLRVLDLSNNAIQYLNASSFSALTYVMTLRLQNNNISNLHTRAFDGLEKLENLLINQNQLRFLDGTLFHGTPELRTLEISNNRIDSFPEGLLAGLGKLEYFEAGHNYLKTLPPNIFHVANNLAHIRLAYNHISAIKPGTFTGLSKLSILILTGNQIAVIENGMFQGLSSYFALFLNRNHLEQVNADSFMDCQNVRSINLVNNTIHQLQPGAFRNLTRLSQIDLSSNNIDQIDQGVFYNLPRLRTLNLNDNQIKFLHRNSFDNLPLNNLFLEDNNLTSASWNWLENVLSNLTRLYRLQLSHNPLQFIPVDLMTKLDGVNSVELINCSIRFATNEPINITGNFEMSSNFLNSFTIIKHMTYNSIINISDNQIPSLEINLNSYWYHSLNIIADNNRILSKMSLTLEKAAHFPSELSISFRNNSFQQPIQLYLGVDFTPFSGSLSLDISYNRIQEITTFPLETFQNNGERYWNPCNMSDGVGRIFSVSTLNISNNLITTISPRACLGAVGTLDLRNNRIEVLDKLTLNSDQQQFKLHTLYLSGNRIRQITDNAFLSLQNSLRTIDLRYNQISDINSFRTLLSWGNFQKMSLAGNPLQCGCELAWLLNDTVVDKLDSLRCRSPLEYRRYLAWCYVLNNTCSPRDRVTQTEVTKTICDQDVSLEISNITANVAEDVVNVSWLTSGPGVGSGFKLTYYDLENKTDNVSTLVHPDENSATLTGLMPDKVYNVCVAAVFGPGSLTPMRCSEISRLGLAFCAGIGVVAGLSSALAVCVLLATSLIVYLVCTRRRVNTSQHLNGPSTEQAMKEIPANVRNNYVKNPTKDDSNRFSDESLYDDIDQEEYENVGFN